VDTLEVLRCTQCDAPLALADSDTIKCPACGTVNDVPAAYRELHAARIADAAGRERGERVLRSLDRPPSMVVKVLARVFDQNMFAFMVLFGVPMGLASVLFALRADDWIATHFHYPSGDDVPFTYTVVIIFTLLFAFAFVPRALGVYANRRVVDRRRLLAAMAAHPPKVAGAAASCRMCGAPLTVEPDKILAICAYCHAQNAVHLDPAVVAKAGEIAQALGRHVRDAAVGDRTARAATRSKLFHELGRYLVRTVLLGGAFAAACQEDADRHPTTVGIIGLISTVALFFFFLIRSMNAKPDPDAAERREGNDVPSWVAIVGPLVFLIVISKFAHC
jgi:phage FluMu protein Com